MISKEEEAVRFVHLRVNCVKSPEHFLIQFVKSDKSRLIGTWILVVDQFPCEWVRRPRWTQQNHLTFKKKKKIIINKTNGKTKSESDLHQNVRKHQHSLPSVSCSTTKNGNLRAGTQKKKKMKSFEGSESECDPLYWMLFFHLFGGAEHQGVYWTEGLHM